MGLVRDAYDILRKEGVTSLLERASSWGGMRLLEYHSRPTEGVRVMEEDWDNLIILDACRYDAFARLSSLPGRLEKRTSRGEVTWNFLQNNFEGRTYYDTVYVTANAAVGSNADRLNVYKLIGLWEGDGSAAPGLRAFVPPETVVDRTLAEHEANPDKRLVAHFLQPHEPFVRRNGEEIPLDSPYRNYEAVREGEVAREEIVEVYEENLQLVLDQVQRLVDELNGRTVVTADHGELLGEGVSPLTAFLHPRWPLHERHKFAYGHYVHVRAPELVEVPWLVIEGDDRRSIVADDRPAGEEMYDGDLTEHLEALGYKT
jgi:hypothetical protein